VGLDAIAKTDFSRNGFMLNKGIHKGLNSKTASDKIELPISWNTESYSPLNSKNPRTSWLPNWPLPLFKTCPGMHFNQSSVSSRQK